MRYHRQVDGEWIAPKRRGFKMACCDCGLVRLVDFALIKHGGGRKIVLRAFRDNRKTAAMRREDAKRA